ncbi:nucleoid-associated protein [Clostridium sp. 1001271B_151109_B4]|uniref:nucleoid-associated protein n=1 Tax=Clostridium sp. 1001271B_151109_B4 TaxID=2787148 RepID=UPI0018AA280A|nr:nucleoid-associated protein [Clostridium sp. 1001271B_151109_B4]
MITNVKRININKAILHIINNSDSHYNRSLLPNDDSKFNSFLIKHIKSSAKRRGRKAANYMFTAENDSLTRFDLMLENDEAFIENSIELATYLNQICEDGSYGPYDLIFCEYQNDENEKFIAVLLLEFSTGFFHEINNNDALIKHLTILASSSSELKKCALIQKYDPNSDYNLVINDKNNADFFISTFLQARESMDNRKSTQTFIEETIIWVNTVCDRPNISTEIKIKLENVKSQCISSITDNDTIDIEAFQNFLFIEELEQFKEDYNTHLERKGLINKEILLTDDVTNDYKVHKIKLDNNVEIKLPIDLLTDDGYTDYYNRTISDNGTTTFSLTGKVVDESVKSR